MSTSGHQEYSSLQLASLSFEEEEIDEGLALPFELPVSGCSSDSRSVIRSEGVSAIKGDEFYN